MREDKKQTAGKRKHESACLLLVALLLSVAFSLTVCAGEKEEMPGQQPDTSQSSSQLVKPSVSGTRVIPQQTPAGHTIHKIYGGPSSDNLKLLGVLDGDTKSGQWLTLKTTANDVRYLKVRTTESPSWISWREIEVYK